MFNSIYLTHYIINHPYIKISCVSHKYLWRTDTSYNQWYLQIKITLFNSEGLYHLIELT